MVTATALQLHPACTVVLDEAAAGSLRENDHYQRSGFRAEADGQSSAKNGELAANGHAQKEPCWRTGP